MSQEKKKVGDYSRAPSVFTKSEDEWKWFSSAGLYRGAATGADDMGGKGAPFTGLYRAPAGTGMDDISNIKSSFNGGYFIIYFCMLFLCIFLSCSYG